MTALIKLFNFQDNIITIKLLLNHKQQNILKVAIAVNYIFESKDTICKNETFIKNVYLKFQKVPRKHPTFNGPKERQEESFVSL